MSASMMVNISPNDWYYIKEAIKNPNCNCSNCSRYREWAKDIVNEIDEARQGQNVTDNNQQLLPLTPLTTKGN